MRCDNRLPGNIPHRVSLPLFLPGYPRSWERRENLVGADRGDPVAGMDGTLDSLLGNAGWVGARYVISTRASRLGTRVPCVGGLALGPAPGCLEGLEGRIRGSLRDEWALLQGACLLEESSPTAALPSLRLEGVVCETQAIEPARPTLLGTDIGLPLGQMPLGPACRVL